MGKRLWKTLLLTAAIGIGFTSREASAAQERILEGNGVQVRYDQATGYVSLYGYDEDGAPFQMSRPSCISYPVAGGEAVSDFTDYTCIVETGIEGTAGKGNRMTVTSYSAGTGLIRTCEIETVDTVSGLLYVRTSYEAGAGEVEVEQFADCEFALLDPAQTVWSYNGGGEGQQSYYDTLQKIDLKDNQVFRRENRQDETSVGVPAADIYSEKGGIAVGDASVTRRELRTPVEERDQTVYVSVRRPSQIADGEIAAGESFVHVHGGDYYMGLRGYADGMRCLGFSPPRPQEIPDNSYDLRWESWGWEFDWTLELILGKLDELEALGVKQVTLDDGWYNHAGEWGLNSQKLPNKSADMKRLTDAIHERGMTALLWWRPCDGGREGSLLYKEHPEYFVENENGTKGKLAGPGAKDQFNGTTGYALCPLSEGAVQSQVDFVKTAIAEWGFDGLKSDYVWSLPHCYNSAHHHERPEESTENQAVFYREIYRAMKECNSQAFHLLCNCGTPQDYYSLPYVTQVPTADPTSVDQTRRRVKAYKALCGDTFPVTTDHNEIWYPSTIGTGAVLIEKRNMSGSQQAEYERWLSVAQQEELHKGRFIGDLYSYGFDPYETYVVEKDGVMYYAFYKDGNKYRPQGNPAAELKGLNPYKLYRIVDYVNNQVIATNVPGSQASLDVNFAGYLLVKAIELAVPDPVLSQTRTVAEETDPGMVFGGNWTAEQNGGFSGGACKYTTETSAFASFTFEGDGIAWYGQKDVNFGAAEVYLDGALQAEISCNGAAAAGVKLFEKEGLAYGEHTIRIVCKSPVIDIDYLVYTAKDAASTAYITDLFQTAQFYQAGSFAQGKGWDAFYDARDRLGRLLQQPDAGMDETAAAADALLERMLGLRKAVQKEYLGMPVPLPPEMETGTRETGILYRVMGYAEKLNMQQAIPAVDARFREALSRARRAFADPAVNQIEINQAWAELAWQIQYADFTKADKTQLSKVVADGRKLDLTAYQNPQEFGQALLLAGQKLLDENLLAAEAQQLVSRLLAEQAKLVPKISQDPEVKKQAPAVVEGVKVTPQKTGLKVTWQKQADAASYTVFLRKNGKWQAAGTTGQTAFSVKKLKEGQKFEVKVSASNEIGAGPESKVVYTATKPSKPVVKSVKRYKKTGLKITCKRSGETGFEVWVKKGKKAYKRAAFGTKAVVVKKGVLDSGKVSVKIRGVVKNHGTKVYGAYRQVKI